MGIYTAIEQRKVTTEKVCFINRYDRIVLSMDPSLADDKTGEDIEIQREFLADILYQKVEGAGNSIFENTITKIENNGENTTAYFEKGQPQSYHLIVGADGLHSNVRKLVFGKEEAYSRFYGMYAGVIDIELDEIEKTVASSIIPREKWQGSTTSMIKQMPYWYFTQKSR